MLLESGPMASGMLGKDYQLSHPLMFAVWVTVWRYFSIAVTKHHDPGNLQKQAFNWACSFRGLESKTDHRHGSGDSWEHTLYHNRKERELTGDGGGLLQPQSLPLRDILPPRPRLLILLKHFYQLGSKYQTYAPMGPFPFKLPQLFWVELSWKFYALFFVSSFYFSIQSVQD